MQKTIEEKIEDTTDKMNIVDCRLKRLTSYRRKLARRLKSLEWWKGKTKPIAPLTWSPARFFIYNEQLLYEESIEDAIKKIQIYASGFAKKLKVISDIHVRLSDGTSCRPRQGHIHCSDSQRGMICIKRGYLTKYLMRLGDWEFRRFAAHEVSHLCRGKRLQRGHTHRQAELEMTLLTQLTPLSECHHASIPGDEPQQ